MRNIWSGYLISILILASPCLHRMEEFHMPFVSFFGNVVAYIFAFVLLPSTIQACEANSKQCFFLSLYFTLGMFVHSRWDISSHWPKPTQKKKKTRQKIKPQTPLRHSGIQGMREEGLFLSSFNSKSMQCQLQWSQRLKETVAEIYDPYFQKQGDRWVEEEAWLNCWDDQGKCKLIEQKYPKFQKRRTATFGVPFHGYPSQTRTAFLTQWPVQSLSSCFMQQGLSS